MKRFISLTLCCLLVSMLFVCPVSAEVAVAPGNNDDAVVLTVSFGANNAYIEATGKLYYPNMSQADLAADNSNLKEVFAGLSQALTDENGVATFTFEIDGVAGQYSAEFSTRKTAGTPITTVFPFAPSGAVTAKIRELCALAYNEEEGADNSAAITTIAAQFAADDAGLSGIEILGIASAEPEISIYNAMTEEEQAVIHEMLLCEYAAMEYDDTVVPTKSEMIAVFKKCILLNALMAKTDSGAVIADLKANAAVYGLDVAECYTELFLPKLEEDATEKDTEIVNDAINTFLTTEWTLKEICSIDDVFSECVFMSAIKKNTSDGDIGVIMDAVPDYLVEIGIDDYEDATNKSEIWAEAASAQTLEDFVAAVNNTLSTEPTTTIKPSSPSPSRGDGGRGSSKVSGVSSIIAPAPVELEVFGDLGSVSWAEEAILGLAEKNILNGKETGKFFPGDDMKREEFAKVLVLAFGLSGASDVTFTDVDSAAWYYEYVMAANAAGIINGQGETFGIGGSLTRQDMAVMIGRILETRMEMPAAEEPTFADGADISDYAKKYVACLSELGIVSGVGDNNFEPQRSITRAEVAKVIYSVMKEVAAV